MALTDGPCSALLGRTGLRDERFTPVDAADQGMTSLHVIYLPVVAPSIDKRNLVIHRTWRNVFSRFKNWN